MGNGPGSGRRARSRTAPLRRGDGRGGRRRLRRAPTRAGPLPRRGGQPGTPFAAPRQGFALLFTSSEIEETIGVCDRVLVMYKGRIIREFAHGAASKADVMEWVAGGIPAGVERVEADGVAADPRLPAG